MSDTIIFQIVLAKIRYICKCMTQWFLASELQDNAYFFPILYNARIELNVVWSLQNVNPYSLLIKL